MGYRPSSSHGIAQEKIHPDYYQAIGISQLQQAEPSVFGRKWVSRLLPCAIVVYIGIAVQALHFGMNSASHSVSIPPRYRVALHDTQRIRIQYKRYLRRIEQVETNVQTLTNVLTVIHSNLMEAIGEPSPVESHQHKADGQSAPHTVFVTVPKANLRAGPGLNTSAVMAVSRGTELLVDTVEGPWLRVFAPNGERLWVAREIVEVAKDIDSKKGSIS